MKRLNALAALAAGAAAVTVALTGAAFWLSYEHLHDVADANGLNGIRAWAWPGTVDLFIVAGELLILRAALRGRFDWFAYLLAGVGSLGSIALNVAGVGAHAQPMEYVVAAVPPSAALIAFAALMRQVHERLAGHVEANLVHNIHEVPPVEVERVPDAVPGVPVPEVQPGEAYPEITAGVPEDGSQAVADGDATVADLPQSHYAAHPAATPRTRSEVRAPVPVQPDHRVPEAALVQRARKAFADELANGRTPSVRTLKDVLGIGQVRAQRIQRVLAEGGDHQ